MSDIELLRKIEVSIAKDACLFIHLLSWEQQDYIDDVLTEKFNLSCQLKTIDDDSSVYYLHFGTDVSRHELESALKTINDYHASKKVIYETI